MKTVAVCASVFCGCLIGVLSVSLAWSFSRHEILRAEIGNRNQRIEYLDLQLKNAIAKQYEYEQMANRARQNYVDISERMREMQEGRAR